MSESTAPEPGLIEPWGHLYGYLLTAVEIAAADGHTVPCDPDGVPVVPDHWLHDPSENTAQQAGTR